MNLLKRTIHLNAHDKLRIQHALHRTPQETQAAYRKAHPGYPEWMPVGLRDAEDWMILGSFPMSMINTALSIPAIITLTPELFERHMKGTSDGLGWWIAPALNTDDDPNPSPWASLAQDALGAPALPMGAVCDHITPRTQGYLALSISFVHIGEPMLRLPTLLAPLLAKHRAKAVYAWSHTHDRHKGYATINPPQEKPQNVTLPEATGHITFLDDDHTFCDAFDAPTIERTIHAGVGDPDFDGLALAAKRL